jgi:hypothetical protein
MPMNAESRQWRWVRLYYRQPCKDALILGGVWPALTRLAMPDGSFPWYFERSSVGGPNVLLGIRTDAADSGVIDSCIAQMRSYVARHPSMAEASDSRLLALSDALATYEARPQAPAHLHPDNYVLEDCAEPSSLLLDGGGLQEATRTFKRQSTALVLNWLNLIAKGAWTRQSVALQCLIGVAWLVSPSRLRAHVSYRSHVEGLFRNLECGEALRASFARHYERGNGESMQRLITDSVRAFHENQAELPQMSEYIALLRETMADMYDGLKSGRYKALPMHAIEERISDWMASKASDGEEPAPRFGPLSPFLDSRPGLRTWQISINLVYALLNQLGVSPMERFVACYSLTRAIEDLYGETADDVNRMLAQGDGTVSVFKCFERCDSAPAGR